MPIPNRDVVLSCKIYGVPIIKVVSWQKDGKTLRVGLEMAIHKVNERQLVIKSYDLSEAGIYTCRVSNDITSGNCSATLLGKNVTFSKVKDNRSLFINCSATRLCKNVTFIKDKQFPGKNVTFSKDKQFPGKNVTFSKDKQLPGKNITFSKDKQFPSKNVTLAGIALLRAFAEIHDIFTYMYYRHNTDLFYSFIYIYICIV